MKSGLPSKQKGAAAIEFASVDYPTRKLNQVMPFLILPGVGTVPALSTTLSAQSSLQL